MLAISLTIACSRYTCGGVILHAHPVRGESHNQRITTGEVVTLEWSNQQFLLKYLPVGTIWCSIAVRSTSQTDEDLLLCCMTKESDEHAAEIVCRTTTVQGMQYGCLKLPLNNRFFAISTTIC